MKLSKQEVWKLRALPLRSALIYLLKEGHLELIVGHKKQTDYEEAFSLSYPQIHRIYQRAKDEK